MKEYNALDSLYLFDPVVLGQTDVMRISPTLLGCGEDLLDEAPMLGGLQMLSQCAN